METALRETHEEFGLRVSRWDVTGIYHDFPSITKLAVTPVVAVLGEVALSKLRCLVMLPLMHLSLIPSWNAREIDRVFSVPLKTLSDPSRWEMEDLNYRGDPQVHEIAFFDSRGGFIPRFMVDPERRELDVWGLTGRS